MPLIHAGIESGAPIRHGPHRLTLRTLVLGVRIPTPAGSGMLLYNRPIQVIVETGSAPARALPVLNFTRIGTFAAVAWAMAAAYLFWRFSHDRK